MKRLLVAIFLLLLFSEAFADKKIQQFIPALAREHGACTTQVGGMLKVSTGAATLAKAADATDKAELEKAAVALAKGHAAVADYCNELGAFVKYLKDNAGAAYKSVEREIDKRHTKVGTLRRAAKRLVEELAPLTRKLIPRITKLPPVAPDPEKRTAAKFPSGRVVELPVLAGSWKLGGTAISDVAEYEDKKAIASITTRPAEDDCTAQRKLLTKDAEQLSELVKSGNATWAVSYTRREESGSHLMIALCAPNKQSSMLAVADITLIDDTAGVTVSSTMTKVAYAMLAARKK